MPHESKICVCSEKNKKLEPALVPTYPPPYHEQHQHRVLIVMWCILLGGIFALLPVPENLQNEAQTVAHVLLFDVFFFKWFLLLFSTGEEHIFYFGRSPQHVLSEI